MTEDLLKAAMAGLVAYHAGMSGVTPIAELPASVFNATDPYSPDELLLPLLGLATAACVALAAASGTTTEAVLTDLGLQVATFDDPAGPQ